MHGIRQIGYLLLLVVAFVVGLMGTVAMSKAVIEPDPAQNAPAGAEQPVEAPTSPPRAWEVPTIEC